MFEDLECNRPAGYYVKQKPKGGFLIISKAMKKRTAFNEIHPSNSYNATDFLININIPLI